MKFTLVGLTTAKNYTFVAPAKWDGGGMFIVPGDYQPGFTIYLSQNTDKQVEETHITLMKGTKLLWHS